MKELITVFVGAQRSVLQIGSEDDFILDALTL